MDLTSHAVALAISATNVVYSIADYNEYEIFMFSCMSMIYALPTYFIYRYKNTNNNYKPVVFLLTFVVLAIDSYYYFDNIVQNICILAILLVNNMFHRIKEITWLSLYTISMIVGTMHSRMRLNIMNHIWFICFMTMYGGSNIKGDYKLAIHQHAFKHVAFGISNMMHMALVYSAIPDIYDMSLIIALAVIFGSSVYFHYTDRVQEHTNEIFANMVQILCYMQLEEVWNDELILILVAEVVMNSILIGMGMNKKKTDELNIIVNQNNISKYMLPVFMNLILTIIGVFYNYNIWIFIFSWLIIFAYLVVNNIRFY